MSLLRKLVLGLALAALLVVAVIFGWQLYRQWMRPTIAKNGGTILIYEIDDAPPGTDYKSDDLVAALHRRLRYAAPDGITIRPVGDKRIEIALPRGREGHARDVARVKELLAETGRLEFRILANSDDDTAVFDSVLNNPAEREQLKAAAASDKAPSAPRPTIGKAFDTELGSFTYSWIELGREERAFYALANEDEGTAEAGSLSAALTEARKDHKAVAHATGDMQFRTNLFYSRVVRHPDGLPEKERGKKYEYFILTRDPERDDDGQPKAVTGDYLEDAYGSLDVQDRNAIGFTFNTEGAARLKEVTTRNKHRQLAIILDGVVRSAPNVEGPIGATGIITGDFTHQEVDRLVNILRAGALPATLKPEPVSETTVEPTK